MNFFLWLLSGIIPLQLLACSSTIDSNKDSENAASTEFNDNEFKAYEEFIDSQGSLRYFHSHKLPLPSSNSESSRYHAADSQLIESLSKASSSAFYESLVTSPIIRHERPGYFLLNDELHGVCAEFRAKKSSIDPNAYSKLEKYEFLEKISTLGAFTEIDAINVTKSATTAKNQKNEQIKERLQYRAIFSATIMASYFCRDALRLVASVLDSSQIAWLLNNSTESIVCNSELLDQLNDFSMFEDFHVVQALINGHYDWFKNPKALKTLKPSALIGLFLQLNFDLTPEQLDLLNSSRPIEELFKTAEFYDNSFVWQVTAASPYARDDHINIEGLVEAINNSSETGCSDELKQVIFSFYVHSENAINYHINHILLLVPSVISSEVSEVSTSDGTSNIFELPPLPSNFVLPPPLPSNFVLPPPLTGPPLPSDFVLPPLPPFEEFQENLVENHLNGLEFLFSHRQQILSALVRKYKNLDIIDVQLKNLIGFFVTPSSFSVRSALKIVEQVQSEFSATSEPEVSDLIKLLKAKVVDVFKKTSLILAYCELKFSPVRCPYRDVPENEIKSTKKVVEKLRGISLSNDDISNSVIVKKWPRMFLIQQAFDYKFSKQYQPTTTVDSSASAVDTLGLILEGFLIFCDFEGFDENSLNDLKLNFPEKSKNLIVAIEGHKSIESKFELFRNGFFTHVHKLKLAREHIKNIDKILQTAVLISTIECQIMALIQNHFKPEMIKFFTNDLLEQFSEFVYLLKHSQVIELLNSEDGRKLLGENRSLLHNLPTYEDFKVTDIKSLNFQAQYATMVRTLPLIPLLISFKIDEYIFNDPLGLSWRLFGKFERIENSCPELMSIAWKIIPFQMLAESPFKSKSIGLGRYASNIQNYMTTSRDVVGKPLESLREILHWIILQELKFLESFLLINSRKNLKWQDALNAAIYSNKFEQDDREFLLGIGLHSISQTPGIETKLKPDYLHKMLEVLGGPLSQVRAGIFLASRELMDKNVRMVSFGEQFVGFYAWVKKIFEEVGLKPKILELKKLPVSTETFRVANDKIIKDNETTADTADTTDTATADTAATATTNSNDLKFIFNPGSEKNSHTNIPQYREHVEQDVRSRQKLILKLLKELDSLIKPADSHYELWADRVKLLGMFSADGFTLSPDFMDQEGQEPLFANLPLHERILYDKLRNFAGLVGIEGLDEHLKPENMATVIIQFAADSSEKTSASVAAGKQSKKNNKKDKKRK